MMNLLKACQEICRNFPSVELKKKYNEITLVCDKDSHIELLQTLKTHKKTAMNMLMDVCGVDYLHYGKSEWETTTATATGYGRGVQKLDDKRTMDDGRFAVVYHLLSISHKHRVRVRVMLTEQPLQLKSVTGIWPNASWYEREVYDLYGISFTDHPDLRRILTDYGFIGHPFRKDFPLEGFVEMRYDAAAERCVYEPCDITPRVTVAKVIRNQDNRYEGKDK